MIDEDAEFLYRVYVSTRDDMLSLPWNDEQKSALLWNQFQAQHIHYQNFFAGAQFDIVLVDNQSVGRLYLHRTEDENRIIDIAFLPEFRGRGIGSIVMQEILDEADKQQIPVRLRVQPDRPARQWYERLGFKKIEDEQVNWHMERQPN
jgi:ribosomal protein S18 acetylase RimI-like enzyme